MAAILMVGCTSGTDKRNGHLPQPSDSLYTEERALKGYGENPERALLMIDSAEMAGNISAPRASLLRAKVYGLAYQGERLDTARQICEALIAGDFAKDDADKREDVLSLLVAINRRCRDDEQYLHWATLLADHCRQQGEKAGTDGQRQTYETEALRTEAEIGLVLTHLGKRQEGEQKLKAVIRQLDGEGSVDRLDACIVAIRRLITVYREQGTPSEIIPLAERILEKLDHYEQHPQDYAEDSYHLPADSSHHAGFIDFYRSQAWGYLAEAYSLTPNPSRRGEGSIYSQRGESTYGLSAPLPTAGGVGGGADSDSARYYLSLFEQSSYGQSYDGRMMIAPTWCLLGDYQKMNAIYDEAAARMGADTLCALYAEILRSRAMAADAQGRHSDCWRRYADLRQMLNDSLQASKAHEYAASYHHQEQQRQIEREQAANHAKNIVIIAVLVVALLLCVIAVILYRQKCRLRRKNSVLIDQISEAVGYKKMYEELKFAAEASQPPGQAGKQPSGAPAAHKAPDLASLSDAGLFNALSDVIIRERLYLDPSFERQTLVDRFHISQHRVGNAFSQGSEHDSLPDFIRGLRLEHACQLLRERPDMSISDVAAASGFTNLTTFGRDFRKKFDITPSAYRNQVAGKA